MGASAWPVRIGVLLWTERTSWAHLRQAADLADKAGVDSIWLSDHIFAATGQDTDPCFEAWTSLAALAAITSNATLGPLVYASNEVPERPRPMPMAMKAMTPGMAAARVEPLAISAQKVTRTATVYAVFSIE